jgi:hypothetical protein
MFCPTHSPALTTMALCLALLFAIKSGIVSYC